MKAKLKKNVILVSLLAFTVLVAITIPRFLQMQKYSKEGYSKSFPGEFKSAASIYYGDHQGLWPEDPKVLIPKYLKEIRPDWVTGSNKIVTAFDGTGGWVYNKQTGGIQPNFLLPNH